MTTFDDYFYLGKIVKPHGYQGRLTVFLDTDDPANYLETEVIYLDINGALVPYFVLDLALQNNKAVITFQDVETEEKAEKLLKKDMYLPISQLPVLEGNKFYYHEIVGMDLVENTTGKLGKVTEVLEYSTQAIIQTFIQNKEVLIPISDDIITKVDRINNTLYLNLPDGLLEVYLQDS